MNGSDNTLLPAFVGGFRSGSTLLINLLGLHPEVAPWFETKELAEALRWLRVLENPDLAKTEGALIQPQAPAGFDREAVAERMRWYMWRTIWQIQGQVSSGKAPNERYPLGGDWILYSLEEAEEALARWYSAVTENPSKESVGRATFGLIKTLGDRQTALARRRCWINKTPELPRFGAELRYCLGACRIVLLIRNGWEVVRSAHALGWGNVGQLAWWWKSLIEQSRAAAKAGYYLEIRYEDLVHAPAETLNQVLEFLLLPPLGHQLCEDYRRQGGGEIEPSRWRSQGGEDQVARTIFDQIAGDLMNELGYWRKIMQSDQPLVSIIVRTKDRPHLLRGALDSLAAQTYPKLEVIVVNDGGQEVGEWVLGYRARFSGLQYLNLQPGRGRSAAGNVGLEAATGKYLGFLDDDDWLLPEHVATLAAVLRERPEKVVYSGVRCVQLDESAGDSQGAWREVGVFNQDFDRLQLCCGNYLPIHSVLFERSLLTAGCRLDEGLEVYEDWDFWMQLAEHTDFYHCLEVTAYYRWFPQVGSGIHQDARREEGRRRIWAKWRSRWSQDTFQGLLEQAGRGFELADRVDKLSNQVEWLEKERRLTQAHVRNLEQMLADQAEQIERLKAEGLSTQAHVANLKATMAGREAELALARKEHEQMVQVLAGREAELALARKEHEQMVQVLAGREAKLALARKEHEQMVQVLAGREAQVHYWQSAYEAVLASTSWRVTAPLRAVSRVARRLARLYRRRYHRIRLEPAHDLRELAPGRYRTDGSDPYFLLHSDRGQLPQGWVWIEGRLAASGALCPVLYFDSGEGFSQRDSLSLAHLHRSGKLCGPVRLPETVRALRLDLEKHAGTCLCDGFSMREIGGVQVAWFFLCLHLESLAADPNRLWDVLARIWSIYRHQGILGLKLAFTTVPRSNEDYARWRERFSDLREADRAAILAHIQSLARCPKISVLMPVYNPSERWLRAALESVLNQLYPNWELCIADDASSAPHVRRVLEEYRRRDSRIKVVYRRENGHISAASNDALALATSEYAALMDHDDELAEHALYWVAVELNRHPEAELIYTDEDKIDADGNHYDPYFKPDWNPLLLCGQNYLSHLSVYRTKRIREVGGFRQGMEGSQDWDLALRVSEGLTPRQIRHIPCVLYHWRAIPGSTALATGEKNYVREASVKVVSEHFQRLGERVTVAPWLGGFCRMQPVLSDPPKVTLIIPTRNGAELLRRCLASILEKTDYPAFELVVVDNQSDDPATLRYLASLAGHPGIRLLRYDAPFNFSAINNFAVRYAEGKVLGFVNDDIEVISPNWLKEMVAYAVRPEVGAVGAKLYYPDGRIQHAGVILGLGGVAGHAWWGAPRNHPGQFGRNFLPQFLTAVTAACLVVRREVFEQVGSFDEVELAVAFNDVDLCLRIQQHGYYNVWTPFAEAYHHESATRGLEDTEAKQIRFRREVEVMQRRWRRLLQCDPAYNPNLSLERYDFSIDDAPRLRKPWLEFAVDLCQTVA